VKERLQQKERELLAEMAQHETEGRESAPAEVEDPVDRVISSEAKEEQFQLASANWRTIEQIRDALRRIDNGTYGVCLECGRQIEANRLEAIPWTPYCAEHQS
jgi:DnaK suppressor protein